MEERFKVPVIEAYGMTEASHQIASNPLPPAPHKPGSVGIPTGYTIRIQDRHGQECGPDMRGEVWIFGKNLFSGYEDNPAVNAEEFHKGFFRTGDEGYIDPDGYLFLTGRLKELINKGGEKVAPREIEEVFLRCTGVDQAVAFGTENSGRTSGLSLFHPPVTNWH
jgi:long-subunit acyl-CoA synthetase (AMP-forming)